MNARRFYHIAWTKGDTGGYCPDVPLSGMRVPARRTAATATREVRQQDVDGKSEILSRNLSERGRKKAGLL